MNNLEFCWNQFLKLGKPTPRMGMLNLPKSNNKPDVLPE